MAAFSRSDSPAARARSTSPAGRQLPTDETIEQIIQQATANARAASGGRTPVIGRDTRTQLFVGNLPYRVRWQDLKDLFRKAGGTVLRADVSLGPDNRSRGYGTVLLSSAEDAGRAIDMFNGYVWQTRTLEVRPDRLPNDFDSSGLLVGGVPISKMPSGLSPQYGSGASSGLHPLSMSPSSAVSASLQPSSLSSSLSSSSMGTSTIVNSSLAMSTGMGGLQDSNGFSNEAVRPPTFLGDMSRSPSAFKISSLNGPSNTQKPFDSLGLASSTLGGAAAGMSGLGNSHSNFSRSSPPGDRAGRTIYVSNWPSQYGPAEFDSFFRNAGHVVRADLGNALGIENRGYGTIVYSSEDEAKVAMTRFNGYELNGWGIRLQIGKSEQQQHQQITSSQLVGANLTEANHAARRSEEYQHQASMSSISNPPAANGSGEPSYPYATYMTMPPGMPTGYMVASQPGSPYDSFPPSLAYVPVTQSPGNGYPPPLNGAMYPYSAWHHAPPTSPPQTGGDMSSATTSGAVALNATKTTAASSNMVNGTKSTSTTSSSTTRTAPGRITLPQPNMGAYPPAPISPMHGRPPITPSMPSFTFISQPMPTPPLHPQFLSPGLGPYSPVNSSPGFYRTMNPYFNLSPGAQVHYHPDPNAMSNNGVIGSGSHRVNGSAMMGGLAPGSIMGGGLGHTMSNGQVTTPYFDMTAATAGSDGPQEYFPPMPITASLAGAVQSMNLSSTSTSNSAIGSSTGASSVEKSRLTLGQSGTEDDSPYLEPVGVGRDGFPSLSAKHSDKSGPPADGMSRNGLTEWVTTPDDLPSSSSLKTDGVRSREPPNKPDSILRAPPPFERSISADAASLADSKKAATPTGSILGTAGSTSPSSGGSGPIYSSSNKPKLTLGPIPKFNPPERMINARLAQEINRTASGSGATGKSSSSASMQKPALGEKVDSKGAVGYAAVVEAPVKGIMDENAGFASAVGMSAGALKVNGTPNGFRDSLSAEGGGIRRASWTEDASRRQSIINGLLGGHALEGEYVR